MYRNVLVKKYKPNPERFVASFLLETYRVHTEWQWPLSGEHSIMMVTSAQQGEGGVHALPLSLYLPSRAKFWCTLQGRYEVCSITNANGPIKQKL